MSSPILISWLATRNDFKDQGVNHEGPTTNFHKYFWNHHKHVLLYNSERYELQAEMLLNHLKHTFPDRQVELQKVEIHDVLDLQEVYAKTERLIMEYREEAIDIFFSPGAPMMQLSWYLCHSKLQLRTRLIQLKQAQYAANNKPEAVFLDVEQSAIPGSAIIRQTAIEQKGSSDYLFTDSIKPVYEHASLVAQADHVRVMIYGESGTGKENLALYIHQESPRHNRQFRSVNCAALDDELLSSMLFGHKKGAFTSAHQDHKGLFEVCDKGTLFLDEIGDINMKMQQTLLRVLQEGEILPLGFNKSKKVDVRVIGATNRDLPALCEKGAFRWDLYYRLAVFELRLPTLYDRGRNEIGQLLDFFLKQQKMVFRRKSLLKLQPEARKMLLAYPWPGNVRELINVVEHLYVFGKDTVGVADLPQRVKQIPSAFSEKWKDVEAEHLRKLFKRYEGNKRQIQQAAGYGSINTLNKKLEEYGIE